MGHPLVRSKSTVHLQPQWIPAAIKKRNLPLKKLERDEWSFGFGGFLADANLNFALILLSALLPLWPKASCMRTSAAFWEWLGTRTLIVLFDTIKYLVNSFADIPLAREI